MSSLAAYLPIDRYYALTRQVNLSDRSDGAALFADISGFTPLTQTLAQELGPHRGGEELTHYLNNVYDTLINLVHTYHGSIISFAGDGITCWFQASQNGLVRAAQEAVTVALAMQTAIKKFTQIVTPGGQELSLALKVGVAVGPVRRFLVGQPSVQFIDVLAGSTLDRLAEAESLAHRGEVVLTPETCTILEDNVKIQNWYLTGQTGRGFGVVESLAEEATPHPWPDLPLDVPIEQIRAWLLPPVYERLKAGIGDFLTELRPVVALFMHFAGLDYDNDEESGIKLNQFVSWVQTIVNAYEGSLLQLTVGDKGTYLYAGFGAPYAHEDDVERAIHTAFKLVAAPEQPGFSWLEEIQIGLSRGTMRSGAYGGVARHTYGVLGDEVNLAARLMELARPGEIMISGRIQHKLSGLFQWEALPPLRVKGKTESVTAVKLVGNREKALVRLQEPVARVAIVGREAERAALNELVQTLKNRQSRSAILEGEAGIGKSRLANYLLEQAQFSGLTVLTGAGSAIEQSSAYYAWQGILNQLFHLEGMEDRRIQVLKQLEAEPEWLRLAPLLNDLLPGLDLPDNELTAQMSGQVRADNTRELMVYLLQTATRQNTVLLLLEDSHWLDSASWGLALAVSQRVQPLGLVVVTRPLGEPLPVEYNHLRQQAGIYHLRLETLSHSEIVRLICGRLGVDGLPEAVSELIRDKAEGHPFFSEELAYALRDAGLIKIEDGKCALTLKTADFKALNLPDTVQGVITSRIDRLSPSEQLALKTASVVGRVFAYKTLHEIYPHNEHKPELKNYLEHLANLEITPCETPLPNLAYLFKHSIIQDVVYNQMLYSQRRQLHQALARWYEQTYTEDLPRFYPLLAYHWGKAEVPDKTLEYLEKAGAQALRNYASQEAVRFLSEAVSLNKQTRIVTNPYRQANWEWQLGEALFGMGQPNESSQHLERALTLLGWRLPETVRGMAFGLIKEVVGLVKRNLWKRPPTAPSEAEVARLLLAANAYERTSEVAYDNSNTVLVFYAILRQLAMAEAAGPSPELARALASISSITAMLRLASLSEHYNQKALQTAETVKDRPALGWVLLVSGVFRTGEGQWARAAQVIERATHLYREMENPRSVGLSLNIKVQLSYLHGEFLQSREEAQEHYLQSLPYQNLSQRVQGLVGQAENGLILNRAEEALDFLLEAETLLNEQLGDVVKMRVYGSMALAYLRQGNSERALQMAEITMKWVRQNRSIVVDLITPYSNLIETYLALWESSSKGTEQEKALKLAVQESCSALAKMTLLLPVGRPRTRLYQGLIAWLSGNPAKAKKMWQKVLKLAKTKDFPYEQGRAYYESGRHLVENDPQRKVQLEKAAAIFNRLGATYDLERTRATMYFVQNLQESDRPTQLI